MSSDRNSSKLRVGTELFQAVVVFCVCLSAAKAPADEVILKNGTRLRGRTSQVKSILPGPQKSSSDPIPIYPVVVVENDLQRYFVPSKQVLETNKDVDAVETFALEQKKIRSGTAIEKVGTFLAMSQFDQFGRRNVKLSASPKPLDITQAITKLTPHYAKIISLQNTWETGIATTSLPPDVLDAMLRNAARPANNPDRRLAIARFYVQAGMYSRAQEHLDEIQGEFPELADTVAEVGVNLSQLRARQMLDELKLRQAAGQHRLAYEGSKSIPIKNLAAPLLRSIRDLTDEYDQRREQAEQAVVLMGNLQAQIPDAALRSEVAPLRSEITGALNNTNLDRLDAFLKLSADPKLSANEKLALALSGWVLGSANAVTDLQLALRLWEARTLVLEFLRTAHDGVNQRQDLLAKLESVEGVGANRLAQMLPQLPPILDTPPMEPGEVTTLTANTGGKPAEYSVMLPPEYHADHVYPLLVVLNDMGKEPEHEIEFWGGSSDQQGQAQRHGYVVVAPHYATDRIRGYDYSADAHQIVLASINDARRRFNIDSDRIFLAGHGRGGDAAFDIGFSHPDLFAGVIPITGVSDKFCQFYWDNYLQLPLYVVCGEMDGNTVAKNNQELMRMMKYNFDLIYAEYKGCGHDSFYAEIHKLFLWMSQHRRAKSPRKIDVKTLRPTDNRFFWLEVSGMPAATTTVDWTKGSSIKPLNLKTNFNDADNAARNAVHVMAKTANVKLWLSPDMVDFDKRLNITINGRTRWNDFVKHDVKEMLDDLRRRGDRQNVYWAVLEF